MNIIKIKNAFIVDGQLIYEDEAGEIRFPVSLDSKPNVVYKTKQEIELDPTIRFKTSKDSMDTIILLIKNSNLWNE